MTKHFPKSTKSEHVVKTLDECVEILDAIGIPISGMTTRRLERMAACVCAIAGVTSDWTTATSSQKLTSREVITEVNMHFEEDISSGSYDDIRRQDLILPVEAGIIVNSGTVMGAARNSPNRRYSISPEFCQLLLSYGSPEWSGALVSFLSHRVSIKEQLERYRTFTTVPVKLPDGADLAFSAGKHNELQKAVIEEFLPRFGPGCEVLYVGDAADRSLFVNESGLTSIGFFELGHEELPDIVAYDIQRNWLFLIEAVHTSGPMSELRVRRLNAQLSKCTAEVIFVTAFLDKPTFRKFVSDVAWETEVWIAENPDHMIHFNGEKFLGPYST
jgi:hypothetical protein